MRPCCCNQEQEFNMSKESSLIEKITILENLARKLTKAEEIELGAFKSALARVRNTKESKPTQSKTVSVFAKEESEKNRIHFIRIDKIDLPEEDDRVGFDDSIGELANSIDKHGQLEPIVVVLKEDGRYKKLIGRRRILAHEILEKTKIRATVYEGKLTQYDENLIIAHENTHRKNYSAYEKVMIHIRQIKIAFECDDIEAKKKISFANNMAKGRISKDVELHEKIESVIADLGIYKSISTLSNDMSVLSMDKLILDSLNDKEITMGVAKILNKYFPRMPQGTFAKLVKHTASEKLSLTKTEEYIHENCLEKKAPKKPDSKNYSDFKERNKKISKDFVSLSTDKQNKVLELLEQIEKITAN